MTQSHFNLEQAWAGNVPSHWQWNRNKELLAESPSVSLDGSEELLSVSHLTGITPKSEKNVTMTAAESLDGYRVVKAGDLVINTMWAWMGALGVSKQAGIVSPAYGVYSPRPDAPFNPGFYDYLYRSTPYVMEMTRLSRGIWSSRLRLYPDVFLSMAIPVPSLEEQRAIASYLDRETARIDTLIEQQQQLIEMLHERRKALIEEIVFRGLGSSATSENLESWLPATPSHWRVTQLGFMSDTLAGYAFPSDGFSTDLDHVRLLRGVNVKPGRLDWTDVVYWNSHATPVPAEFDLQAGDLVFGMDRPFVGGGVRIAAISEDDLPALLLQRVMRIRPGAEGDPRYFRYVMSTDAFYDYLEPLFTGVSVPHVSEWQVRKFKMPFPPLDEQRCMATLLDAETAKIDTLIAESKRFIELARERRSALITAAVTGQVDVRKAA
ncbi:hypothetical protein ACFYRK_24850 [Streptomyces sp. NPDC005381]|uniref:restriction endonuclease subunit S n=1 Tax=Streptomyces sp. NPDC005381 TaxID=3364714 RepID=UPI0036C6B49C